MIKKNQGFTIIEILIVIALIAILAVIFLTKFKTQIDKANDSKRKEHLDKIKISLQEYYSDNQCFPQNLECNQVLPPYFNPVPCDPTTKDSYLYVPETDASCPQWFKVYGNLQDEADPDIVKVNCQSGCGPENKYNYGVSSSNINLDSAVSSNPPDGECQVISGCAGMVCKVLSGPEMCPNVHFCNDNCDGGCVNNGNIIESKQCR